MTLWSFMKDCLVVYATIDFILFNENLFVCKIVTSSLDKQILPLRLKQWQLVLLMLKSPVYTIYLDGHHHTKLYPWGSLLTVCGFFRLMLNIYPQLSICFIAVTKLLLRTFCVLKGSFLNMFNWTCSILIVINYSAHIFLIFILL